MLQFSRILCNDAKVSGTGGRLFIRSRNILHLIDVKLKYCAASGLLIRTSTCKYENYKQKLVKGRAHVSVISKEKIKNFKYKRQKIKKTKNRIFLRKVGNTKTE